MGARVELSSRALGVLDDLDARELVEGVGDHPLVDGVQELDRDVEGDQGDGGDEVRLRGHDQRERHERREHEKPGKSLLSLGEPEDVTSLHEPLALVGVFVARDDGVVDRQHAHEQEHEHHHDPGREDAQVHCPGGSVEEQGAQGPGDQDQGGGDGDDVPTS